MAEQPALLNPGAAQTVSAMSVMLMPAMQEPIQPGQRCQGLAVSFAPSAPTLGLRRMLSR